MCEKCVNVSMLCETETVLVHSPLGFSEGPQGQCGGKTLAPIKLSFFIVCPSRLTG